MKEIGKIETLFNPDGVVVVGASTHPGKFGFVALHNIINAEFNGPIFATNPKRPEILGIQTHAEILEIPKGKANFAMICISPEKIIATLPQLSEIGVETAFVVSGGFKETDSAGENLEKQLVEEAKKWGILLAGPNGQGLVSTPANLCSQIVSPYPPAGNISIASQSGNILSALMNMSRFSNIGVARAISTGNQASLGVSDYIRYFTTDSKTSVIVAYVEGLPNGREFFETIEKSTAKKPVIIIRGGSTKDGAVAAASHTGSLASDHKVFAGMVKQAGAFLTEGVESAFELAATFAKQPLPTGRKTVVMTTAGGWGVLTADAISKSELRLIALPDDLKRSIDLLLPPRWSKSNPIDLAGGETRDTIPDLLNVLLQHEEVSSLIFLGLGIQGNVARTYYESNSVTDGMMRMADFHADQEKRYANSIIEAITKFGKPVMVASELAFADSSNPGPKTLKDGGFLCYRSPSTAVECLSSLTQYALANNS